MSDSKSKYFRILSIDGGGIRGIIPAMILDRIEEGTDEKVSHLFDLIAGTSTGGIIALALTMPALEPDPPVQDRRQPRYTAADLIQLYWDHGKDIFDRSLRRTIRTFGGWRDEMYSSRGIEEVLRTYFGETYLCEALTHVLIPTYDMRGTRRYWKALERSTGLEEPPQDFGGYPRFFKSERAEVENEPYENYLMRDVARAASAAPTYFEPYDTNFSLQVNQTLDSENRFETLVDGGIFANNPAMCAYAEAIRLDQEAIRSNPKKPLIGDRQILLVSLGTGELTKQLKYNEARDWGKLEWLKEETLFRMIFDGASDTVHYQLEQLLNDINEEDRNYYRYQTLLTQDMDKMDDASLPNLTSLVGMAENFIADNDTDLTALCEKLQETQS